MKLQNQQRLTPQQTSNLKRPSPPTEEAVKRAQFVDKTYQWQGR
jgi:hypothetical protein